MITKILPPSIIYLCVALFLCSSSINVLTAYEADTLPSTPGSVIIEIDPLESEGQLFKNYVFKVENQLSVPIIGVELISIGGRFDVMKSNSIYDISPDLGINNDGINSSTVIATFKNGGLAPGRLIRVGGSDLDRVRDLEGFEAVVLLGDGDILTGIFENIGESPRDDGDPDLWRAKIDFLPEDPENPDSTITSSVTVRAKSLGPVCCAEFKVQLMSNSTFEEGVTNPIIEESDSTLTTEEWEEYTFEFKEDVSFDRFRIVFDNNQANQDLEVDYIKIKDFQFEAEDSSTYAVGVWNGVNCSGGFRASQILTCKGYFHFNVKTDTSETNGNKDCQTEGKRDPLLWPFSSTSIWNLPLHQDAINYLIPANINPVPSAGISADENLLFLNAFAPLQEVMKNGFGLEVCTDQGTLTDIQVPIDRAFSTDTSESNSPARKSSFLLPDQASIVQLSNTYICEPGGMVYANEIGPNGNVIGNGLLGGYVSSGMSNLGGTIRLGELDEPDDVIPHALKISLHASNIFYSESDSTPGYRWPAQKEDANASSLFGGANDELELGALLALQPDFDLSQLSTAPAKIIARAFKEYGGYLVNYTLEEKYSIATEWSPNGRVKEEFQNVWGFSLDSATADAPWVQDIEAIFSNLHVVSLNRIDSIGGGQTDDVCNRMALLAPEVEPQVITDIEDQLSPKNSSSIEIIIRPNPVQDKFWIDVPQTFASRAEVRLINSLGQEVIPWQRNQGGLTDPIDVSNLIPGMYLVQFKLKEKLTTVRIIKQ